jgi:hypothetical protein
VYIQPQPSQSCKPLNVYNKPTVPFEDGTVYNLSKSWCRVPSGALDQIFITLSRVEAGSNTSIVTVRVIGGDEKGSLKTETVKYRHKSLGTRPRERLRSRRAAEYTKDRPVLSSERAPHKNKPVTVNLINIWLCAPYGVRHQDLLIDRSAVAMWLWLWHVLTF